jgi:hypothetical protein
MKTAPNLPHHCMLGCVLAALSLAAIGAPATGGPAPELSLSLRGLVDDSLEQGEPLRVAVRLECAGPGGGPVELAPATGTWVDAISVELLAPNGNIPVARASPVGVPGSARATLDRDHVAGGMWLFAAGSLQNLAPGEYFVRARLSIQGGAGWTGGVSSDEVPLSIVAISSAPDRVSARTLARAEIAFSANALEAAARLLDGVLAKSPDDFELLSLRADVALSGGNPIAAMICINRAAQLLSPKTPGPPPLLLFEVQSRVYAARWSESSLLGRPLNWTWPPPSVLALLMTDAETLQEKAVAMNGGLPTTAFQVPATTPAPARGAGLSTAIAPVSNVPVLGVTPNHSLTTSIGSVIPASELRDEKISADLAGQWAASGTAGTQYGKTQYSAAKATGAPSVPVVGNSSDAWCPASKTSGTDWLEVTFAQPVHATEVRVRQNDAAGAIAKIEGIDADGTTHVWWEGVDPYVATTRDIVWFAVRVPKTDYLVAKVKITLNLAAGPGWKEIDAVQLVGTAP